MLHRLQQHLQSHLEATLSILLLCAFVSTGLIACASNSGSTQSSTPTTPAQAKKCGSVQTNPRGIPIGVTRSKQSEDCFWQAFQKCQPASLVYITTGIDTVLSRTFTIQNNAERCSVSDAVQHAIVPAQLSPAKTYTCTGVTSKADGLHIAGCGEDGDVIVPAQ